MLKKVLAYLTPQAVLVGVGVVSLVAVVGAYAYSLRKPSVAYESVRVSSITEAIDTSGTVKAADSLDLSFDVPGRVASVPVKVGSHVYAGQTIAVLSGADLAASVAQAKAALAMQEAKLKGLVAGATTADLAVSSTGVTNAQNGVLQAKQSLLSGAEDAYVKSDDAIHNHVDLLFDSPRSAQPRLNVTFTDAQRQINITNDRIQIEARLAEWQSFMAQENASSDSQMLIATSRKHLAEISAYLDLVSSGLATVVPSANLSNATLQTYQASIATARTNVSAALSALNAAVTAEQTAESLLATAQSQYALKQSGASINDIDAQKAAVQSAQAAVDLANAQLAKTVIRAPIAGTVTRNEAHLGETVSPGVSLVTLNSDTDFQMETYVSEANVATVSVGQKADVRIDAYTGAVFTASVIAIDPAATLQNGVSAYKVTLQFDAQDPRIKAGLTANAHITANSKENVLTVPTNSIITRGADKYVLRRGSSDELVKVTTGISGNGMTEILSGLSDGDMIRSFGNE